MLPLWHGIWSYTVTAMANFPPIVWSLAGGGSLGYPGTWMVEIRVSLIAPSNSMRVCSLRVYVLLAAHARICYRTRVLAQRCLHWSCWSWQGAVLASSFLSVLSGYPLPQRQPASRQPLEVCVLHVREVVKRSLLVVSGREWRDSCASAACPLP